MSSSAFCGLLASVRMPPSSALLVGVLCLVAVLIRLRQRAYLLDTVATRWAAAEAAHLRVSHLAMQRQRLAATSQSADQYALELRSHNAGQQMLLRGLVSNLDETEACVGRRFASLQGERMLHLDCRWGAKYSIDCADDWMVYRGPVRVPFGETIVATCGSDVDILVHPSRRQSVVARATAQTEAPKQRQPSLLVL